MAEMVVFSERDETALELLSGGKEFSQALDLRLAAAVFGENAGERAIEYISYGAEKVYLDEDPLLTHFSVEPYAQALCEIAQAHDVRFFLMGSSKRGKELAPRVSQKLGAGCITDAIGIGVNNGDLVVDRYTLGGNAVASQMVKTPLKVISVMPGVFALGQKEQRQGEVINIEPKLDEPRVKIIDRNPKQAESVRLEEAERLVCIGRGLAQREDLEIIERLAGALNAEIGCTRTLAADFQWLSEQRLVGLSGKKCRPKLTVSIGISGQIQHTVGILGSKIIVAINKDRNAPIFQVADYGIVGDLYQIVPRITESIKGFAG